jgi:hypothetical protein
MKHLTLIALCAVAGLGCKSDTDKDKEATAAKTTEAEPAPTTTPTEPAAPTYSPEAANELLGKLAACTSPYACEPLETLVGFGDKVSADLATIAVDPGKPKELRRVAAVGLVKIQDPKVGVKLFEAGKAEEDFILRLDVFKAAGASGGDETFDAMIAYYVSDEAKEARHTTDLLIALRAFGSEKLMAYAKDNWPTDKKLEVRFADLVRDEPAAGDKDALAAMLEKSKDSMARHRLASALVKVGDTSKLDILVEGLKAKNEYDRSDAANMLAEVVERVPAERKTEIVELAKAARAKDKGGLTSVGYDKIIKSLGG